MKLLLLHGPAIASSRKKLLEVKQNFNPNQVVVFEKGIDIQEIIGTIITPTLFLAEEQLIVLENPSEDLTLDSFATADSLTLIFWCDHEVSEKKPIFKFVSSAKGQILFFPEGKEISVFPFLDYLGNKNKRAYLEMDKLKKNGFDSQYLITMIFYLLRSLVAPNKNAPSFVKQKIAKQKANFSDDDLKDLYKFVIETDFKIKSGLLEPSHAEFLLTDKFLSN